MFYYSANQKVRKGDVFMENLELVSPTLAYKEQAKELLAETRKYDAFHKDMFAGYSSSEKFERYEEWLQKLENEFTGKNLQPNRVPASTYFLVRKNDNRILGIVNIRHSLNEYLKNYGGHIGYSIRYSERRKGYGKKQLLLALEKCKKLPLKKVLVTCRKDNIASSKTIESCGGTLENIVYYESEKDHYKRYWITL